MKIFYSWQSDLENKYNRGFIKNALESAIKELNTNLEIEERKVELDHDTKGITGMTDLANTIFEKIKQSTIFIADISFIAEHSDNKRKISNPNVLIELGYALSTLGSDKIICIMNTAHGNVENLPFDLKHKRHPIQYHLNSDNEKTEQKKELIKNILQAIRPIISLNKYKDKIINFSSNLSHEEVYNIILSSDSKDDWIEKIFKDKSCVYFKKNLNLRFEMQDDTEGTYEENFNEKWANKHPDRKATGYWCHLFYGSTLIDTFILVSVDGARATLPLPKSCDNLMVSYLNYKIAQIHDSSGTLNEYMVRSGLFLNNVDLEAGFGDGGGFGGGSGDGAGRGNSGFGGGSGDGAGKEDGTGFG